MHHHGSASSVMEMYKESFYASRQWNVLTLCVGTHQLYLVRGRVVLSPPSPGTIVDEGLPKHLLTFCQEIAEGMRYVPLKERVGPQGLGSTEHPTEQGTQLQGVYTGLHIMLC